MKEFIKDLVQRMEADGHDFIATPTIFQWADEELPNMEFTLIINKSVPSKSIVIEHDSGEIH